MKSIVAASLSLFALVGCSSPTEMSTQPLNEANYQVKNVEQINWQEVSIPSHLSLSINDASQRIVSDSIRSPVAAFSFEASQVGVSLELTSRVKDLNVFAPNAAVYDQNFKLLKTYTAEDFDYDRNDFVVGEALNGEVSFIVPSDVTHVYVLIYTTDEDLEEETVLIHPAKAMAIAKRTDPPKIEDPIAKHTDFGVIEVSLTPFSVKGNNSLTSQSSSTISYLERAPEESVVPETHRYYTNAIKLAVAENDLNKALSLLDEAKALGVEGAQEVFVKAVNAK